MAAFPHKQHTEMKGHVGPVFVVRFNKDGDYCLTGGKDRSVCLWNPHKGVRIKEYAGEHGYEVLDVQVTNDNSKFASCGGDKNMLLWDVSTGRIIRRFRGHEGKVNSIVFNKDGGVLVSAGYDTNLLCWDMRATAYKPMQTISNEFKDSVTCVTCTDDAIIACSIDGSLKQFDIRMGGCVTDHVCKPMTSLRMSADNNCVLVQCLDDHARLFDKSTGELLNSYMGHISRDYKVEATMSNCDSYVVSGSEGDDILIWSLVEGKIVHRLKGHTKGVCSVDYHPKLPLLVSASFDGTVRCWK